MKSTNSEVHQRWRAPTETEHQGCGVSEERDRAPTVESTNGGEHQQTEENRDRESIYSQGESMTGRINKIDREHQ